MATIVLEQPMDTIQFIFGSTSPITRAESNDTTAFVDFGTDLTLTFFGAGLAFAGFEPNGGTVTFIRALRFVDGVSQELGTLTNTTGWLFTRDGLAAAYAAEAHAITDSAGFDVIRGGDQNDTITIDGSEDRVLAGPGNDRIALDIPLLTQPVPPMDLDGGDGSDTLQVLGNVVSLADLRGLLLTSIEGLVATNGMTLTMTQTQALSFAAIESPGTATFIIDQDRATLDLDALAFPVADLSTLVGQGRAVGDTILGNARLRSELNGNGGADTLMGNAATDVLFGGGGRDTLFGGAGRDELEGDTGGDTLNGGRGNDTLEGDAGRDLFIFGNRSGQDEVLDFKAFGPNRDTIDLTAIRDITGFRDLMRNHLVVDGDDLILQLGRGNSVELENVARADLDAGDFLLRT